MRKGLVFSMFTVGVFMASAQQPSAAPSFLTGQNGKPAAGTANQKYSPEVLDTEKYPFAAAQKMLGNNSEYTVPSVSRAAAGRRTSAPIGQRAALVHPVMLQRDVALSPAAQTALSQGQQAIAEPVQTTTGKDGRILFTYGLGLPTIVCAPLRVCTMELEPGEKIMGEPEIGDSTRWEIAPASSGTGENLTPIIVIKPHAVGLDTNLVVTTNKRTYYVRLVSKATEYIARTAFTYKDDEDRRWKQYLAEQQQQTERAQAKMVVVPLAGDALDHLNFRYTVTGGSESIRPVRVCDDGVKTYITMPDAALHRELPALIIEAVNVKGEKGQEIVNYRVKDNIYIVDRLFDRAALLLGVGKKADKVELRRDTSVSGGK